MTSERIICGIDPGLAALGWGIVIANGSRLSFKACGTIKTSPKQTMAQRLCAIHEGLTEVIDQYALSSVAVEETFVNKDQRNALGLAQARGICLLAPAQKGLDVAEYAPNLIKKSVVGNGHADKAQIRTMVEVLLPTAKARSDHEADALAIAITHAHLSETNALWGQMKAGAQ